MELVHFKNSRDEKHWKLSIALINTSTEYDDMSDDLDEDEEGVLQYGTSAWTSDPTQHRKWSSHCNCFYVSAKLFLCYEWKRSLIL